MPGLQSAPKLQLSKGLANHRLPLSLRIQALDGFCTAHLCHRHTRIKELGDLKRYRQCAGICAPACMSLVLVYEIIDKVYGG